MLFIASVLALLVGVTLGIMGGGGSILTVPILRYVLGLDAHQAIAMSMLVVFSTSLAAVIPHARRGSVRFQLGASFGGAGMVGAFLASRLTKLIPGVVLLLGFAALMFATAFAMLRRTKVPSGLSQASAHMKWTTIALEGFAVGAVTGLLGAGGGFVIVPALVLWARLPMTTAIGTSLVVVAMNAAAGFIGSVSEVAVDWRIALSISAAAVAGSIAGSALGARISPAVLKQSFGWFVIAMAYFILAQELPPLLQQTPSLRAALMCSLGGTALTAGVVHLVRSVRAIGRAGERARPSTSERRSLMLIAHATELAGATDPGFYPRAALAAAHSGGEVATLHVVRSARDEPVALRVAELLQRWGRPASAAAQRVHDYSGYEDIADALLDACTQLRPDLVVLPTHVRTAPWRLLFGSHAESLARNLSVPSLLLPFDRFGFVDPATGTMRLMHMLVLGGNAADAQLGLDTAAWFRRRGRCYGCRPRIACVFQHVKRAETRSAACCHGHKFEIADFRQSRKSGICLAAVSCSIASRVPLSARRAPCDREVEVMRIVATQQLAVVTACCLSALASCADDDDDVDVATARAALSALTQDVDATVVSHREGTRTLACAAGGSKTISGDVAVETSPVQVAVDVSIAYEACQTSARTTLQGTLDFAQNVEVGVAELRVETSYRGRVVFTGEVEAACAVDVHVLVDAEGQLVSVTGSFCDRPAADLDIQITPRWRT